MKTKVRFHKLTAWLLTLAMLMTLIPSFTLGVSAADGTDGNVYEQMLEFIVPENNYGIGDIPENRIFHAWGWSYQNIKTRLETIAEQGFSTILVSPPNEIKMPTKDVKFHEPEINGISPNGWWMLYQPAGFQINESGDNALGTKSKFIELCEDAHRLGFKIMVEAVVGYVGTDDDHVGEYDNESNEPTDHVSPRVAEFEPELLADEEAFHFPWVNCTYKDNYRDGYSDYDIEEDLTQHAVDGKPDLATKTQLVQDIIFDYFIELVEAGADGFYFNDAKHIETASDTYFPSDFWEDTLGKIRQNYPDKNIQAVGELIGGSGDGRSAEEYLQYGMNLTNTTMSDTIRDSVVNGTDITDAFDDAFPQENSVLWGESYKSYANGETSALTSEQRAKIWALTVSRKGVKGIYLARPSDTLAEGKSEVNNILSTITLGEGNVTDWSADVVKRINHFAGFFEDTDENVHYDNGISVIERDGKGAVLVNMQGKETAISLSENTLIDGEYTDAITENKFTVENGKITGEIGESGVAVLYLSEDISIFNLRVGGEQVTSRNLVIDENDNSDITSGSATYDPHSNTLTLNNFTYSGDEDTNNVICYTSSDDLKLVIEGTNSIICTNDRLLVVDVLSNMEISGNGSLSITGGDYGMNVMGSMTVTSGSLSANGGNYGVNTMSGITVSGGSLSATGGRYGVNTISGITVSGGSLSANGGSIGVNTLGEITISGGETVAKGATNAFSKAPTISDTFNNAVVWYGESEDAANEAGAKDISELADNYNQKYIKVAEDAVVPVHSITVTTPEHGTVTADKLTASEGETVTLTVTPAENYDIDTVTYNDGISDVEITATGGVYSFTMPASFVTVYATFVKSSTEVQFEVVKEINDWNAEGSFTFKLQAVTEGAPMPTNASAVATEDTPSVSFGTIVYDEIGTYEYTITEVQGSLLGMSYDPTPHTVIVTVTQGADYKLSATVTYDGEDQLIITNTYTPMHSVRISAVDIDEGFELEGATLQILDENGYIIDEWVSTKEPHAVEALRVNENYTIQAAAAPSGYKKCSGMTVRMDATHGLVTYGSVTEDGVLLVEFAPVGFIIEAERRFDIETRENILFEICDAENAVVASRSLAEFDDWAWKVIGLPMGNDYTVRVTNAPWGYANPADISVSIDRDGNVTINDTPSADGVIFVTFEEISPAIHEIVFNSDSDAYDAETNTFYYDSQHLPRIVINGQDLLGQKIYLGLENSAGNHLGFYDIAEDDTGIFMPLNKATLDETLDTFAMQDMTADIVKIRAEITGSPDAPTYLELNIKPKKYSITLDSNGADTASVTLETDYRKLTSLPTPERVGYAFNGWFDAQIGGNEITTDTVFEQDTTIYAQWTKLIPKITGIAIDATSSAYDAATDTFTVFKDKPFVAFLEGENFINIDDEFLETNAFGFVPSVEDSENALGNALAVFKDAGFVTIDVVENRIKLTFDYDAMKTFIAEHGRFEGICYGDIVNIKEENIESVNIALAKYDPIYTEPTVKTGLVYNGAEQELLIPGTAEGGTMKYYIGGTQATAEVPTRKAAGEYTVTCIIAGDQFHNNIVVGEYTVSIAKKTIDYAISLTAPVKNAAPQTEITGDGYTAMVVWSPEVTDTFAYNTEYTATVTITPDENHTVAGIAANGYTVEGAKTVTNDENSNIVTVAYEKTGSRPSFGGGGSSNTTTTTTKNEDGSTTKVTENKTTGTKTEVTTNTDGSTTTVETKKDGTVTTTEKDKDGNTTTTVEKSDGSLSTEEVRKDGTEVKTETTTDGETTAEVKADEKVEVTIPVPDPEKVQMVVVTDENGNNTYITEVEINNNGVAVTTDGNATVSVMSGNRKEFVDVHHVDHWSEKSVDFVHILGLMNGTSENHFSPDVYLTRAMLVTVLYRAEGEPEITNDNSFADVENGSYYEKAVAWAKANGIVNGTSATTFEPNMSITREQIAAIMHRYADFKGHDVQVGENTNILSYDDVHNVSEYAIGAMQYAVGSGLIKGKTEVTLNPLDNATRAEAAAILERFIKAN